MLRTFIPTGSMQLPGVIPVVQAGITFALPGMGDPVTGSKPNPFLTNEPFGAMDCVLGSYISPTNTGLPKASTKGWPEFGSTAWVGLFGSGPSNALKSPLRSASVGTVERKGALSRNREPE